MRVAWVSPMPPMPSGIADYSFELLPEFGGVADVEVVCPRGGLRRRVRAPRGIPMVSPEAFERRAGEYDAIFYHLGNNPAHEFVYELAQRFPGVQVFHDFLLHHLIAHLMVEAGRQWRRYEGIFRDEHGEAGARLADLRWRGVADEFEKFAFPLNRHVARLARAIVVHNLESAERMEESAPGIPVTVVPHHAGSPPPAAAGITREEARRRLHLPQDAFVVGQFGYVTRPKQPAAVVGGFAAVSKLRDDALLAIVGADRTGGGLQRLIDRHYLQGKVRIAGYVDLDHFYLYLRAVDAVVNLRYPSAGESSGTAARALAEGRPLIVNNAGSFAELPDDVALKVEIDGDQAEEVGRHLIRLVDDPPFRAALEAHARAYAATVLDPARCRDLYLAAAAGQLPASPHTAA